MPAKQCACLAKRANHTASCRLAINPHDDAAFLRVLNVPVRRIGDALRSQLLEMQDELALNAGDAPEQQVCGTYNC